jgi:hypothetical protein
MQDKTKISVFLEANSNIISTFLSNEESEFYKFLKNTPNLNILAFENNWPYILQATRNGKYKLSFKDSAVYFTLRYKQNIKDNFIVIVNSLGKQRKEAILYLCNLLDKNKIKFLIKNVDRSELSFWLKKGFKESVKPWSRYSFRDDNSFPLYIISSDTIKQRKFNRDYKRLFRRFDKQGITSQNYSSFNDNLARKILTQNANFLFKKGVDKKEEVIGAHLFFFDENINERIRIQHLKGNELIGVSYLTKVNQVVFYNALFCDKKEDLMKYLLYCGMKYAADNFPQVKYFSIQGSENQGQDFFKKRYYPSMSIEKTHIIN